MRQQTDYNKLVGRKGDEYYFCDYIFDHGDNFKGATGTVLVPISKDEYEERTSEDGLLDYLGEHWQGAVSSGETEMSKSEWVQWVYDVDGDDALFDFSGSNLWDQLREIGITEEEFPVIQCQGGGRCFGRFEDFDEIYDQELWEKIQAIESQQIASTV